MQHDCRRRGGRGRTRRDTELQIFILPPRKTKHKHRFDFSIGGATSAGVVSVLKQVLLLVQNNKQISAEMPRYLSFFLYEIGPLFIQSLRYSVILSQASLHTGLSVSVPMTTSLFFFPCLSPPLPPPPLQVQEKTEESVRGLLPQFDLRRCVCHYLL